MDKDGCVSLSFTVCVSVCVRAVYSSLALPLVPWGSNTPFPLLLIKYLYVELCALLKALERLPVLDIYTHPFRLIYLFIYFLK